MFYENYSQNYKDGTLTNIGIQDYVNELRMLSVVKNRL